MKLKDFYSLLKRIMGIFANNIPKKESPLYMKRGIIKMLKKQLLFGLLLFLITSSALADTNGKISGVIKDKNTGERLLGVNVVILGTDLGAASNSLGEYFIINIPPGTYTVKASYIGYSTVLVKDVKVNIDRTTTVDFEMEEGSIQFKQEIVVEAKREKIRKDVSFSQNILDIHELETAPTGVDLRAMIATGVGVERDQYGHLSIRGSMVDEIGYYVDGLSGNDKRLGIPIIKVPEMAVKEIQIMTGGFNAEYGEARSGMINIVTKDGGQKYSGSIDYRVSPSSKKHFGPDLFSPNNWWDVGRYLYLEPSPDRDGDGVPDFEGWNSFMARNREKVSVLGKNGTTVGIATTPEDMLAIWEFQHRPQAYASKPDHYVEGTFGGPVPLLNDNLTFFFSGYYDRTLFPFRFSIPAFLDQSYSLKMNYKLSSQLKLRYTGNYGQTNSVTYDAEPGTFVDAHSWDNVMDAMDGVAAGHLYNSDTRLVHADVYRTLQGMDLEYVVNNNSFYQLNFQYDKTRYRAQPGPMRDTLTLVVIGGVPLDETPLGFAPNKYKDVLEVDRLGEDKGWRDYTWYESFKLKGDYTNQVTTNHMLKGGLNATLNKMYLNYGRHRWDDSHVELPAEDWTERSISYLEFAGYLQDKIEFGGMIMNIGVRLDGFKSFVPSFTDPWSYYYQKGVNFDSLYSAPSETPGTKIVISPRLGVSHPITENAKLFFNYGYFYQRGTILDLFTDIRQVSSSLGQMGNPNLAFRKTISYELGIEHNLFDIFTYKLSGYYKDVSNEISTVTFDANTYNYSYLREMNNEYRDIMGFELELNIPYSKYFNGRISYDYRISDDGIYGYSTYFEDPFSKNVLQSPNTSKPKPRPYFKANLTFMVPDISSSEVLNAILSNLTLSTYIQWRAGNFITYHSEAYPGTEENNIQWTSWSNIDLNISKRFELPGITFDIYTEIQNLLNSKFLNGNPKFWDQSIVSQEQYLELVAKKGLKPGTYNDPDVQKFLDKSMYYILYGPTRDIWFGLRVML